MKKNVRRLLLAMLAIAVMMGMGTAVFAEEGGAVVPDGTYQLNEIKSSLGMFKISEASVAVNGEDAALTIVSSNADRYGEIYLGSINDITDENKDTVGIKGTVIDEANKLIQFVIPMKTADLNPAAPMNYVLRYRPDHETNPNVWYKSKSGDDYTLTLGALTMELNPANTTGMFIVEKATLTVGEEQTSVTASLSGTGYENLYKGTYEQAVENGEARENWIAGSLNEEGKWTFRIPVSAGESKIPVVAISKSKLQNHDDGTAPLEEAFYPRQLVLDSAAATLTAGDYDNTIEVSVINNVSMFKPGTEAELRVVGGPNSNNYAGYLTLHMGSTSFDQVRAKTYTYKGKKLVEGDPVVIDMEESGNTFRGIPILPALLGENVTLEFHSKSKDEWYKRDLTASLTAVSVTFNPFDEGAANLQAAKDAIAAAKADLTNEEKVDAALEAVDKLTDAQKETLADDIAVLNQAKEDIEKAKQDAADKEAAAQKLQAAKDAIAAAKADLTNKELVDAALTAIAALNDGQKAEIADDIKAMEDAKAAIEQTEAQIKEIKSIKITLKSVKAGKKKATVKWKKNKKVDGYVISYKTGSKTKTVKVKKFKTTKKVIKKLKAGKKYTVKVRGYKKINGEMVYTKWSKAKKVKIKK